MLSSFRMCSSHMIIIPLEKPLPAIWIWASKLSSSVRFLCSVIFVSSKTKSAGLWNFTMESHWSLKLALLVPCAFQMIKIIITGGWLESPVVPYLSLLWLCSWMSSMGSGQLLSVLLPFLSSSSVRTKLCVVGTGQWFSCCPSPRTPFEVASPEWILQDIVL